MNYYKVIAKCGHVGRGYYYEGEFFAKAADGKEAAAIVRQKSRVKHGHKDAIFSVAKIERDAYLIGQAEHNDNPYFHCKNVQQQRSILLEIIDCIFEDNHNLREEKSREDRLVKLNRIHNARRKAGKYGYANDFDFGDIA